MLQRAQSVWLLLAGVLSFLTIRFSIYAGTTEMNGATLFKSINGSSTTLILLSTIATGVLVIVAIFLYKNRPLQIKLGLVSLLFFVLTGVLYYFQIQNFGKGNFTLTSILFFPIPIFILLALKGIYSDQKLIKSVDRLR